MWPILDLEIGRPGWYIRSCLAQRRQDAKGGLVQLAEACGSGSFGGGPGGGDICQNSPLARGTVNTATLGAAGATTGNAKMEPQMYTDKHGSSQIAASLLHPNLSV